MKEQGSESVVTKTPSFGGGMPGENGEEIKQQERNTQLMMVTIRDWFRLVNCTAWTGSQCGGDWFGGSNRFMGTRDWVTEKSRMRSPIHWSRQ